MRCFQISAYTIENLNSSFLSVDILFYNYSLNIMIFYRQLTVNEQLYFLWTQKIIKKIMRGGLLAQNSWALGSRRSALGEFAFWIITTR